MPSSSEVPNHVIVHPLVLLSSVDHFNRVARGTKKRVMGILLGSWQEAVVNVTNSYAIPFEEDEKDPSVWFVDHNYHEAMFEMFKKVNAKEKVVGWYHSGPKLRQSDLEINELIKRYVTNPVLVIIDVKPKDVGIPTDAYFAVEQDGTATTKTFNHVSSSIEAEEAEEIGVEHLLRDVKDNAVGTLSTTITSQLESLKSLQSRLEDIHAYLAKVVSGSLPFNHKIIYNLQDIFNLLPNLNHVSKAFTVKTNDEMLIIYISSMIRSIIALHNLIDNKLENRNSEEGLDKKDEKKEEKEAKVEVEAK